MKLLKKKGMAILLLFAVCISGIAVPAKQSKAAEADYEMYLSDRFSATAGVSCVLPSFTVKNANELIFDICTTVPVDFTVNLTEDGSAIKPYTVLSTDVDWKLYNGAYWNLFKLSNVKKGALYSLSLTFTENVNFNMYAYQEKVKAYMNYTSATVTKGFKTTLSVIGNTEMLSWSSSNSSVAAVAQSGIVTGKKAGTATITAKSVSGQTYTCVVSVKNNAYTHTRMNLSEASYGQAYISITKVSYDKKGNVVIKATYLNNCGHKIVRLKNVKIKVKTKDGKLIGTFNLKSKKTSIGQYATKSFTYKIKKSKLKLKKKQDLRQSVVVPTWRYVYTN